MKVKSYFISIHPEVYTIIGHISPGRIHLCFLAPVFSESFLSPRSSLRMGLVNLHVFHDFWVMEDRAVRKQGRINESI